MATKIQLVNMKHPKIELIDRKNKTLKKNKKLSNTLIWILVLLILVSLFELIILFI